MSGHITNSENDQFGPANIPFGVVSTAEDPTPKVATRLYGQAFILPDLIDHGFLSCLEDATQISLLQSTLNTFASLGRTQHRLVREALQDIFKTPPSEQGFHARLQKCAIDISRVRYYLPVTVGDFSDFSCSKDHVLNAGEAVLGIRQLPPGFLHFPIGYGGRSSSILSPGTPVRRPLGQFRSPPPVQSAPSATSGGQCVKSVPQVTFGPSRAVDFELEVACVIGKPSNFGCPIHIANAEDHLFGFLLLNDWSARDIQGLEMNPLGPFNGKSFGTSISPWIITMDALQLFRTAAPKKELELAVYLQTHHQNQSNGNDQSHFAIQLQAAIEYQDDQDSNKGKVKSAVVCSSKFEWLYWTVNEMIAHQTINGCPLNAGDILATGTISGSEEGTNGCLLEITQGGKKPVRLSETVTRTYLQDGDAVRLTGFAGTPGTSEFIGFGSCFGVLQESISFLSQRSRGVKDLLNGT